VTYRVDVTPTARRALRKVTGQMRRRLEAAILLLAEDPRPPAARRLADSPAYRVRIGDYRIVYEVHDDVLLIVIVTLGHRRDVYSRWHGQSR
jgi:mRNA interferase RelE/StbE